MDFTITTALIADVVDGIMINRIAAMNTTKAFASETIRKLC